MNRGFYILILLPIVVSVVVAVAETMRHIRSRKRAAANLMAFLRVNFDALANSEGVITAGSLRAAKAAFPDNGAEIAIIGGELDTIGHKISSGDAAKGAVAITTAVASPAMTGIVVASDFSVYGIARQDLDRLARVESDRFGRVSVWKLRATK